MVRFDPQSDAGRAFQKHVQARLQQDDLLGSDFVDESLSVYIVTLMAQVRRGASDLAPSPRSSRPPPGSPAASPAGTRGGARHLWRRAGPPAAPGAPSPRARPPPRAVPPPPAHAPELLAEPSPLPRPQEKPEPEVRANIVEFFGDEALSEGLSAWLHQQLEVPEISAALRADEERIVREEQERARAAAEAAAEEERRREAERADEERRRAEAAAEDSAAAADRGEPRRRGRRGGGGDDVDMDGRRSRSRSREGRGRRGRGNAPGEPAVGGIFRKTVASLKSAMRSREEIAVRIKKAGTRGGGGPAPEIQFRRDIPDETRGEVTVVPVRAAGAEGSEIELGSRSRRGPRSAAVVPGGDGGRGRIEDRLGGRVESPARGRRDSPSRDRGGRRDRDPRRDGDRGARRARRDDEDEMASILEDLRQMQAMLAGAGAARPGGALFQQMSAMQAQLAHMQSRLAGVPPPRPPPGHPPPGTGGPPPMGMGMGYGHVPPPPRRQLSPEEVNRCSVVVKNVHFNVSELVLREFFGVVGPVARVTIRRDPATGRPRGYAFVQFADRASVKRALELSGTPLLDREISVVRKEDAPPEGGKPAAAPAAPAAGAGAPVPGEGVTLDSLIKGAPALGGDGPGPAAGVVDGGTWAGLAGQGDGGRGRGRGRGGGRGGGAWPPGGRGPGRGRGRGGPPAPKLGQNKWVRPGSGLPGDPLLAQQAPGGGAAGVPSLAEAPALGGDDIDMQ